MGFMSAKPLATIPVEDSDSGSRLDRFLRHRYPSLPQSLLQKLLRKRTVTVNRRRAGAGTRLQPGDAVEIRADLSRFAGPTERARDYSRRVRGSEGFHRQFRILYEDDRIVVLDKPGGLVVHPAPGHRRGDTLLDLLRAYLPEDFSRGSPFRPAFVHRLDRGTSGVIVAARTQEAARRLEAALREGKARKTYIALAHGRVRSPSGTIDTPLEETRTSAGVRRQRAAREGAPGGRTAVTRFRVERRFHRATLLRLELETGRTHQIRVHLASMGHPIVGDGDYGSRPVNRAYRERYGLRRLFLHAADLEIPHPGDGRTCVFRAPLPPDLEAVLDGLGRGP